MPSTGITPTGFVPETVQQILAAIEADELSTIDAQLDLSPEEPVGQLNGVMAEKLAEIWEVLALCYNGYNRNNAEGPQLDNVNGLTGTKRLSQSPSYVLQSNVFSQTGTFPAGSLVANVAGQPSVQFANSDDIAVTFTGGIYYCTDTDTGVVLASSNALPISVPTIKFICTVDGPVVANAGTLTQITSPVTGWAATTNALDAVLGTNIETDTAYRIRGDQEISAAGSGNTDAMRADLLNVPGVINAFVIENTSNNADGYGNPPHSFLAVIWDGVVPGAADSSIAQAIWNDMPNGIQANGQITDGIATDSLGGTHVVPFSRATQDTLYLVYNVVLLPGQPALTSATALAMKQAIVANTQALLLPNNGPNPAYLNLGSTVYAEAMKSALMQAGMGVATISSLTLGFSPSPGASLDLPVDLLTIAIADTSRITINGL